MRSIKAVFTKQILSFFKNPAMVGTPIAFLGIPFILLLLLPDVGDDRQIIVSQFLVMFAGMSMIMTPFGFIAEDRQTMNLRFMSMAGVRPYQYLLGTCGALWIISLGAISLFGLMGNYFAGTAVNFLIMSMLGVTSSMLLGITLGLSKFAPFTPIVGLLLGVGPMFSEANEVLSNIYRFLFTQQITDALRGDLTADLAEPFQIVLANMAVIVVIFIVTNFKNGLDNEKLAKTKHDGFLVRMFS